TIATDDQPARGEASAPVTLIEFTDYECPTCAKTHPIIEELVKEYAGSVRWVVRDFPLQTHAYAFKAAEAAEAARDQGRYWEYIAILFQDQTALSPEKLKAHAARLGLDRARFDEALDAGKLADRIQRDLQDGIRVGIISTPTVFVNGRRVTEKTRESLKAAIDNALKDVAKK
ncbi:MAG TPA: thioredoxin domain-containing protein, partial [Blastocatellia bacterium]|nr:thioredoxin domain-containing protein [Blastocatellia bacterium]